MRYRVAEFIGSIQDGGAETIVRDYALMLDKSKYAVIVIVLRRSPENSNDKVLVQNGIKIIPIFKNNNLLCKIVQKMNYWWYVPLTLRKILREEKIDVLHIHMTLLHYVKRVAYSIKDVKLFYTCHTLPKRLFQGKNKREFKAAIQLIKKNDLQLIALHNQMKIELNALFDIDNTIVLRNGVDFRKYQNCGSKQENRKYVGIPQDAFVIGHIGRFESMKNHDFLVDVFNVIQKKNKDAFLLMIGSGRLKRDIINRLEKLGLSEKYLILEHREDIPNLLTTMDAFVFPSKYEGLGIALIEAQLAGLRCIASDNVPHEAFCSDNVIAMSLQDSLEEWSNMCLGISPNCESMSNMEEYDMNQVIKLLESLYAGELNV